MTMVKLKTKSDKHALDNERRRKSIKEREKAKLNQSLIIKQALSNSLNSSTSKKIILDDDYGDDNVDNNNSHQKVRNGKERTALFDGSGSEDEDFEIKEKSQFSGKKGFELLNLQSTYGNDERFKIDERFLEDEKDDLEQSPENRNHVGVDNEKAKELKILESVLGQPVKIPESEKKAKKRTYEMVRYDASNKEHEKYVIKSEADAKESSKKKKKKERKSQKAVTEDVPKPQVSKEKFYEVSNEITSSFKEKKEDGEGGGSFSILQAYSQNDNHAVESDEEEEVEQVSKEFDRPEEEEEEEEENEVEKRQERKHENDEVMKKRPKETKGTIAQGIWKESFFFASDDPRFNEGLEFINKKDSKEAAEAAENYDQTRRKLREILRLHVKKQQKKRDPFRHKVGGMSKKQMANLKSKNNKTNFSKRKPPKVNSNGKI